MKTLQDEPLLGLPRDSDLAALVDMFYPDYEIDASGKTVFGPADAQT
ncbi:hypothetical protein BURKHO8Y_150003 [Burkholderia sp. 8Y]|nr:hypothetical protein BURKHO8Y_150003 [Burkholderia sp. 8Y]